MSTLHHTTVHGFGHSAFIQQLAEIATINPLWQVPMPPLASSHYLERIRDAFPDLMWVNYRRVQTIADPDHVMILLDNGIAFRFENDEDANLTRERIVLDALRSSLKAIPILLYPFQANCGIL